ncbi:unnamed protein product [Symbiodinium pilosum]|uniref:DNA (cytosine-5-)-methyltransferase n=1 Tax=Symbiodinium pilosum TaxID=2952 RepID=A0A812MI43_SYMPI|nr:unnamed protein product [Symbiodinium pilosum]
MIHWRCPCITRARGSSHAFWITSKARHIRTKELARAQGWPWQMLKGHSLTQCQIGAALGNAWPLPVAVALMKA